MDYRPRCEHRDCQQLEKCKFFFDQSMERHKKNPPTGCYFADPVINSKGDGRKPIARCQWKTCITQPNSKYNDKMEKYAINIYCDSHIEKCQNYGCTNRNVHYQSIFCDSHRCAIDKCARARHGRLYCVEHQCMADNCGNLKTDTSFYCADHRCPLCFGPRLKEHEICLSHKCEWCMVRLTTNRKSTYCSLHWCYIDNCPNRRYLARERATNYCQAHTCDVNFCDVPITIAGRFCGGHRCFVEGCKGRRVAGRTCCATGSCLKKTIYAVLSSIRISLKQKNLNIPRDIKTLLVAEIKKIADLNPR